MAEAIILEWILPGDRTSAVAAVAGPPGVNRWGSLTGDLADQADLAAALDGRQPADDDLAAIAALAPADNAILQRKAGAWTARSPAEVKADLGVTKADVGLGSVENVALGAWSGSGNVTTLGTVTSGSWAGSVVAPAFGGTGQSAYAAGDMLYASGPDSLSRLPAATAGSLLLSGAVPAWAKADLSTHVTGVLPVGNGGTGQTTAGAALNALLPSQAGAAGKVLASDGTSPAWQSPAAPVWGAIGGTLSAQTDLQTALGGKLSLSGGAMTGALALAPGAVGAPGLHASGDSNTGFWFPAADTLAASVGGAEAWRADSTARVGVGMTSLSAQFSVQSANPSRQSAVIKGASGQTASLMEWQSGTGTVLAAVDANGHVGLNKAAPDATSIINCMDGGNERVDSTATAYGMKMHVSNALSGNVITMLVVGETRYSSGRVGAISGINASVRSNGAGGITNGTALYASPATVISGTIDAAYAVRAAAQKAAGVTVGYGFVSEGANDYNVFAGSVSIGPNLAPHWPSNLSGPSIVLGNVATPPSGNPGNGGGVLYVEAGVLKFRGGSGTVTIIGPA